MIGDAHVCIDRAERCADCLEGLRSDKLAAEEFFVKHGFAQTTTYNLLWEKRKYPPKAILGTAYEFATGHKLNSSDFEGGKSGAVRVLEGLGFIVKAK